MNRSRLVPALLVLTGLMVASAAPAFAADKKPTTKPKAPKKTPPPAKPKPKPNAVHNPAPTHAHSTIHRVHHNYYAGRAGRSLTWYRHHRHRGWTYEVRFRSRNWRERTFASRGAARTFMHHLRWHHFERHLYHPRDGVWMVTYRNPHSHHFATYTSLPVARRVEGQLRQSGHHAWLRWHRRYF